MPTTCATAFAAHHARGSTFRLRDPMLRGRTMGHGETMLRGRTMVHGETTVRRDDMVGATTTTIRSITPIPATSRHLISDTGQVHLISSLRLRPGHCRAILIAFVSFMAAPGQASGAARFVKVVNVMPGHVLWLRSGPGFHFNRVGFLPREARHIRAYTCKSLVTGRWCQVRYRGTRGWALQRYLADDPTRIVESPVGSPEPRRMSRIVQSFGSSG